MSQSKNKPKKNTNSARQQMDTIKKILWIGGVGLVVMIITTLVVSYIVTKDKKRPSPELEKQLTPVEEEKKNNKVSKVLGVIHHIEDEDGRVEIYDIEKEGKLTLFVDGTVELKDQYGQAMTLSQFRTGDIVQVKYAEEGQKNKPEYMKISSETWIHQNINNLKLNIEQKQIQVGSSTYHYTDALVTRYKNQPFDLTTLDSIDEVTLKGYKDQVLTIILEKSHGYVTVENYEKYEEGTIEIDTNIVLPLKEANQVPVLEGIHKIVIHQADKQPFTTQIMVESGKNSIVNPGETPPKVGALEFQVNVKGYDLYIDDTQQPVSTQPMNLNYGEYKVVIRKQDYEDWTGTIKVHQPYTKVKVDLIQQAKFIHMQTNPSGAEIYIDDNFVGYSPVSTPLELGEHKVLLRKEGFQSKEHTITIKKDNEDVYYTFPPLEPKEDLSETETTTENTEESEE
ncbi:MAG: PEGA domain-containing protein [Epulopiscium sp.]|nr:PEGA domain-containing protein [Candidatus Epulonipiscium sp.]